MQKVTILNANVLTNHGDFSFRPVTLERAKELVAGGFDSAVGHQSTCDVLTSVLGVPVPLNRVQYKQLPGEVALVFKLKGRIGEGVVMTAAEIEEVGYEFSVIEMGDSITIENLRKLLSYLKKSHPEYAIERIEEYISIQENGI